MSGLPEIQTDFQSYVLNGGDIALEHVVSSARGSAEQRLEVYYQAYRLRLLEVLESNFPGLRHMLSDAQFEAVGNAYIDGHPSRQPSIRWFGDQLAGFIESGYPDHPEWADMARFDWARDTAFDAADVDIVEVGQLAELAGTAWPGLQFELHPSVSVLELHWNVCDIWRAANSEEQPPEPARLEEGTAVVVWRKDLVVCWRSLPDDEAAALTGALNDRDFSELCTALSRWHPDPAVPARSAGILKQWVTDGLISRILS